MTLQTTDLRTASTRRRPRSRRLLGSLAGLALATASMALVSLPHPAEAAPATVIAGTAPAASAGKAPRKAPGTRTPRVWTPRAEQFPGTVKTTDLAIPMSDGVVLRGDLTLPADASGVAIDQRFPVVVTITAYNKSALASSGLGGASGDYLVQRGYATLVVDARGTGSSAGQWNAFDARENQDAGEIMTWAHEQPWSNGKTAMTGPSYMGISQLWAAAAQPPGLKAIFPQVPGADVYRDVVASGGAIDVGFIPLWLGLVTGAGLVPPAYGASDPESGFGMYLDHLMGAGGFTAQVAPKALLGQEPAYDGPFYEERSVINVIDRVKVPAFFVSGEYDLFQRGTPLLFEALQDAGVPTKLVVGPWDHLQGSSGADLGEAGYGSLSELQLRWFDHYVKGMRDPRLDKDIAPLTYYEQGSGRWTHADRWIDRDLSATSYALSGSAEPAVLDGTLTTGTPEAGTADVLPIPVSGACTRSANQWTAGVQNAATSQFPFPNPCLSDNRVNDLSGVVFDTAPIEQATAFRGPINARLYVSTEGAGDGMLAVSVEDVAPDGTVSRLSGGWQVLSLAELDESRSRYLDGQLIQAYHPFTQESQTPLTGIQPVDVEIFPTAASIEPGHSLRLAVQAFDVPHALAPLPVLAQSLTNIVIHTGPDTPSVLTVPSVLPRARATRR